MNAMIERTNKTAREELSAKLNKMSFKALANLYTRVTGRICNFGADDRQMVSIIIFANMAECDFADFGAAFNKGMKRVAEYNSRRFQSNDIKAIFSYREDGFSFAAIGEMFGVSGNFIRNIIVGKVYKSISIEAGLIAA